MDLAILDYGHQFRIELIWVKAIGIAERSRKNWEMSKTITSIDLEFYFIITKKENIF